MTAPAATTQRASSTAKESTALALTGGNLPDLTQPANLIKFAALFAGDQLSKLNAEQQTVFLTTLGTHLGVRAELGEIMLYQGKPYITIDGRIRIAHNSGLLNGIDPGPASSMERTRYIVKDGEHLWKCLVWKKGSARPFVGWGHVRIGDRNPVTKTHPQEMAKKRARYDALRLAFPPKEEITPLHEQYIQEAEDEARARGTPPMILDTDGYDDAPDDHMVLGEEIAAATPRGGVATDDTPPLEDEPDPAEMTLEQAKLAVLTGPPGSWNGKVDQRLDTFSTKHLESIRTWLVGKIEERGDDPEKQTMVSAIGLLLDDRGKASTSVKMPPGGKVEDALPKNEPKTQAEREKGLPF